MHNDWRIYRLPGSREVWHIDSGPETEIVNARGYRCLAPSRSVDVGGNNVPRAWIAIPSSCFLHLVNGVAIFAMPRICKCRDKKPECSINAATNNAIT